MDAQIVRELDKALESCQGNVLENVKNKKEEENVRQKLQSFDSIIRPVMYQLYYKYGGIWTNQRAYDEARKLFEVSYGKADAKSYAKYFRYRWGAFMKGLQDSNLYPKKVNKVGKELGALKPVSVLPPMPRNASDKVHINYIHTLAKNSVYVDQIAQKMLYMYDFDNIKDRTVDLTTRRPSVLLPDKTGIPTFQPNLFMHPLFVALGATQITNLNRRILMSDMARVVSNRIKGGYEGTLRSVADQELYYDLTTLPNNKFCSRNQMDDMYKRSFIHTLLKNEISAMRTGDLHHSSHRIIHALRACQQTPLQTFKPDNAVDMLYKISNALSYYPTTVSTLPRFAYPGGPIPQGRTDRVPFLRVMLPQPHDPRFERLAENWRDDKLVDNGLGGGDTRPVYSLKPDKVGKVNWVHTPNGIIHKNQMKIVDSRTLMFVVDRRASVFGHIPNPLRPLDGVVNPYPYADIYRVNKGLVNVEPMMEVGFNGDEYVLKSAVALELGGNDNQFSVGYKAYVMQQKKSPQDILKEVAIRGGAQKRKDNVFSNMTNLFDNFTIPPGLQTIYINNIKPLFKMFLITNDCEFKFIDYLAEISNDSVKIAMTEVATKFKAMCKWYFTTVGDSVKSHVAINLFATFLFFLVVSFFMKVNPFTEGSLLHKGYNAMSEYVNPLIAFATTNKISIGVLVTALISSVYVAYNLIYEDGKNNLVTTAISRFVKKIGRKAFGGDISISQTLLSLIEVMGARVLLTAPKAESNNKEAGEGNAGLGDGSTTEAGTTPEPGTTPKDETTHGAASSGGGYDLSSLTIPLIEFKNKLVKKIKEFIPEDNKTIVFILTLVVFVGAAMYVGKKVYDKKQSNPTMSIWDALKELTTSDFPAFTNEQAKRGRDAIDEALKYASKQQKQILKTIEEKINASVQSSGGSEQQSGGSSSNTAEEIIQMVKEGNAVNLLFSIYSPQDIIKGNSSKLFVTDQKFSAIKNDLAEKGIIFIYEKI